MSNSIKTFLGFAAALSVCVLVASLTSCVMVLVLVTPEKMLGLAVDKTLLTALAAVIGTAAVTGAILSTLVIVLIAWPLYLLLGARTRSLALCISVGFLAASVATALFIGMQGPLPPFLLWLYIVSGTISGCIGASAFWLVRYHVLRESTHPMT